MFTQEEIWLNYVLGNELDVAGTLIFEGLEHIASLKIISNADEVFSILYYLSQGFERLVKIASLIADENPRSKMKEIKGHKTNRKFEEDLSKNISIGKEHKELLNLVSDFYEKRYNHIDYGAKSSDTRIDYPNGDFSMYPNMLREYVERFCTKHIELKSDGLKEHMRCNMGVKRFLHLVIKELAKKIYEYIHDNSLRKNLYTYELCSDSKAFYVFLGKDDNLLRNKVAIYELLLYAMKGKGFEDSTVTDGMEPLELDMQNIKEIVGSINSKTCIYDVLDAIDAQIEDMAHEQRKNRLLIHSYILED
jgi:hypothetical protein